MTDVDKGEYVSRAALKLASVAEALEVSFQGKNVLDVGSSTGGFTQYALNDGALQVVAVEVGTNQMHHSLRTNPRIHLFEKMDIRDVKELSISVDVVVADVSFISLRQILPHVAKITGKNTQFVVMVKPQFEAGDQVKHKGVIKNDKMRRDILKDFEVWVQQYFIIRAKADSAVAGAKGNRERFYRLQKLSK